MSSWQDRLRDHIKLTSPSGLEFTPGWKGDDMSVEKRVAQFQYPTINGTVVQDQGRAGHTYSLTLYFEGDDNDTESLRFIQALDESGSWTVVHPVDGTLTLQPIGTFTRPTQPVTSGNLTVIVSSWIVPYEAESTASSAQLASAIEDAADELSDVSSAAAVSSITQDIGSEVVGVYSTVKQNVAAIKKALVSATTRINTIQNQIEDLISGTTLDIESISGTITQLLQSPGLVTGSLVSQLSSLSDLGSSFIDTLPSDDTLDTSDLNAAVTGELFLNATASAMATTIVSDTPDTRSQALVLLSTFQEFLDARAAALDDIASRSAANYLSAQYFQDSSVTEALANLRDLVGQYLLSILFDLKTERRFTLAHPRAPLEIALSEYAPSAAEVEDTFDLFCRSNNLHGRDLLLLPAGREVVIYA